MILFKWSSCFCLRYECEYVKVSKRYNVTFQIDMFNSSFLNKKERRNTRLGLQRDRSIKTDNCLYLENKYWNLYRKPLLEPKQVVCILGLKTYNYRSITAKYMCWSKYWIKKHIYFWKIFRLFYKPKWSSWPS